MDRAIYSATTRALCYTPVGKASLKPRSWSGEVPGFPLRLVVAIHHPPFPFSRWTIERSFATTGRPLTSDLQYQVSILLYLARAPAERAASNAQAGPFSSCSWALGKCAPFGVSSAYGF